MPRFPLGRHAARSISWLPLAFGLILLPSTHHPLIKMDITCLIAALLFLTGNILLMVFYLKESQREHFDIRAYMALEPDYLIKEWEFIRDERPKWLSAGIINGMAWFVFSFPIIQLAWILSQRGSRSLWLHVCIAMLALTGTLTEWLARFLYIGSSTAMQMLTTKFNLNNWMGEDTNDQIGWRTLEVTHIVVRGLILFVDAFEWICLFFIMVFIHISVRHWRVKDTGTFGVFWNSLGLFIGLLSILDFVAEVLRLDGYKLFGPIAFWYAIINRCVLIPLWLIILGLRLPHAANKLNEDPLTMSNLQQENGV